jgi:hypothetical protein
LTKSSATTSASVRMAGESAIEEPRWRPLLSETESVGSGRGPPLLYLAGAGLSH